MKKDALIIVRGGGDLATGTIHRLWSAGFRVLVLEAPRPAAIRRRAAVCEAVYEKSTVVEGMEAVLICKAAEAEEVIASGRVPVLVDPEGESIAALKPAAVVDAILAKRDLGTNRGMAPLTIALGPGFTAGADVDVVIETMRGHNLGRVIRTGTAQPNTGIPGNIGGYTSERVLHAPAAGIFYGVRQIGDIVAAGEEIAFIAPVCETGTEEKMSAAAPVCGAQCAEKISVTSSISGVLRGLLRDGYPVTAGFKVADIDPRREERKNCFTISDKARCIAGGVLEAVCAELCRE